MKDYREEAERVYGDIVSEIGHGGSAAQVPILAAALQAAYREGVEAMREAWISDEGDTRGPMRWAAMLLEDEC